LTIWNSVTWTYRSIANNFGLGCICSSNWNCLGSILNRRNRDPNCRQTIAASFLRKNHYRFFDNFRRWNHGCIHRRIRREWTTNRLTSALSKKMKKNRTLRFLNRDPGSAPALWQRTS
jgi:hypothetical protein